MSWHVAAALTLAGFLIVGGTVMFIVGEYRSQKRRERYNRFECRAGRPYFSEWTK